MLTLCLLRHAKSSWDDPELPDHERPLAKRGAQDAPRMGKWLARERLRPDLVLCSDAVRTRATLTLVLAGMEGEPPVDLVTEPGLYLATPSDLLARLQSVAGAGTVLMIGHNPGLHALALDLTGRGATRELAAMAQKFPTCGLAVLTFPEADTWADVRTGCGHLAHFVTPRSLS